MKKQSIIFLLALLLMTTVFAENISDTNNTSNISDNSSLQLNQTNNSSNETIPQNETIVPVTGYQITNFIPKEFKLGESQINIQLQNTGETELKNLLAFVSGKGFSTSDITPIDLLRPGEKSYIILSGNFKEPGNISLTIKIGDKTFSQDVKVIDPNAGSGKEEQKQLEEKRRSALASLSSQFDDLNKKYSGLESELETKRKSNYDVSSVSLADLKKFLRDAQSSLIIGDVDHSNASLSVALSEYNYQKSELDQAQIIKKSLLSSLKDNAIIISTLAGAVITSFALYELLKKKKEHISQTIKVVVEKAKKGKEAPKEQEQKKEEAKQEGEKKQEPNKEEAKKEETKKEA